MHQAWILSVGSELTSGASLDTNAQWLSQRLAEHGIRATRHVTVADELEPLCALLDQAVRESELVLVTGGLGPTEDDLTREALARCAGVALVEDVASLAEIEAFFARRARPMPEPNRVQARVPVGGAALPNHLGTAPGIFVVIHGTPVCSMPGVPFEMMAMFRGAVLPRLPAPDRVIRCRLLHCCGLGESVLGERIRDLMLRGRNPEIGTTAGLGLVSVRITAHSSDAAEAERLLDQDEADLRRRLGPAVFGRGEETLAAVVGARLVERGQTLAAAESCTGGLLAKLLTDAPGSSKYFQGGAVAYSNEAKVQMLGVSTRSLEAAGAVSAAVALEMAAGIRQRLGSTYALSLTGVAGPDGGSVEKPIGLVFIGLSSPAGTTAREFRFGEDSPRLFIRERAALTALDWLRREFLL